MDEGHRALKQGDRTLAHELWREAAMLEPYNERVWLALLDVLDSAEDRQVCLQNIVEINPLNTQARRMLRAYENSESQPARRRQRRRRDKPVRGRRLGLVWRALLLGVLVGLSGIFFAIVLSILIYAT